MVHLKKLCVGIESADQLREYQAARKSLVHLTRNFPRRSEEIIGQGSLYWIIKGRFALRQKILDLQAFTNSSNKRFCRIVLDDTLVAVRGDKHHGFQGWRYLELEKTPPDTHIDEAGEAMPEDMSALLDQLGIRAL